MRALKIVNERRNVAAGLVNVRLPPLNIFSVVTIILLSTRELCFSKFRYI